MNVLSLFFMAAWLAGGVYRKTTALCLLAAMRGCPKRGVA